VLAAPVLTARLLLAAVFAAAAIAKLADREGTREAVVAFGAAEPVAGPVAQLLPIAELAVAVLLLPAATAVLGAIGALALLLLFSAAIVINLRQGRTPECHCFGQLHSAPAGPGTLARNAALAAVAALAVAGTIAGSDMSAVAWIGRLHGAQITAVATGAAAAVLLVAGAMAFMSLLRAHGRVLVRLERMERTLVAAGLRVDDPVELSELGLEPGTPAPRFAVTGSEGAEVTLDDLLAPGRPLLMLFASPNCGPCEALLPDVAEWQAEHADRLTVAVASERMPEEHGLRNVLVDEDLELYRAFEANGTPGAVLIAPDGSVASHMATGPGQIEALVAGVLDAPGLPVGAPVPELELPSLGGERVKLADLRGRDTLLLFWDPGCGHCRAMHDDLLAWESNASEDAPRLVVISSGDPEDTRSEGFRFTTLLDEEHEAGEMFGIGGTPMGVLLGADGRVASGVAAGARAVLALAEPPARADVLAMPGA
jgi:thiol-disulfide isomerase/thioredoxin